MRICWPGACSVQTVPQLPPEAGPGSGGSRRTGGVDGSREPTEGRRFSLPRSVWEQAVLAALVLGAVALRLAWLGVPLEHDEAGYTLIGGQWHPGTSLYGDYWVDRPPLLIAFFALGHALGGSQGVRLLGCVVAALTVLVSYGLGKVLLRGGGSPLWPAAAAAAFISTPMFQVTTVNGELIAVPLVLAGTLSVIRGVSSSQSERTRWWVAAGAFAAAACLVKQSFLDVFVFAGSLVAAGWMSRSGGLARGRPRDLGWLAVGAVGAVAGVLLGSALLGTTPQGLWEAIVVFRVRAAGVLGNGGSATNARTGAYPQTLLAAGALPLVVPFVLRLVGRRPTPLMVAALCTILWEAVAVLLGQQAWSHYLIGLTPGLVLAAALSLDGARWIAAWTRLSVCYAVAAALTVAIATHDAALAPSQNQVVGEWLHASARSGDQAVVLVGQPDILEAAGMGSPYEYMWSLPIAVEDPRLDVLLSTLEGPRAPVWVVQNVSRRKALAKTRTVLEKRYVLQGRLCGYRIYLRAGISRSPPPFPPTC